MKNIHIQIPDNYVLSLKEFVSKIPNSIFEENENYELSNQQKEILEERSKMSNEMYMTIEEVNAKLKSKYV